MKALVTGGAGFIGSHVVDRLLEEGYEVVIVDNLSEGKLRNLEHLRGRGDLTVASGDLTDYNSFARLTIGCDAVFHLAAHANIRRSTEDHRVDLQNNVTGTINVLEAMVRNGVPDLIFASTSAVYGKAKVRPTPEDYFPIQTSLYGASKLACEAYAEAYAEFSNIHFWAYRFANVVGERCRRGVIWDFVDKLNRNPKELEILGDGMQSKAYVYVKDCAEGMMVGYKRSREKVNIFNLAVEENTTVNEVADLVEREMGLTGVRRKYTGGPSGWIGDSPIVQLSIERIKNLGWRPELSGREAITRTAKWAINETSGPSAR